MPVDLERARLALAALAHSGSPANFANAQSLATSRSLTQMFPLCPQPSLGTSLNGGLLEAIANRLQES